MHFIGSGHIPLEHTEILALLILPPSYYVWPQTKTGIPKTDCAVFSLTRERYTQYRIMIRGPGLLVLLLVGASLMSAVIGEAHYW